MTLSQQQKALVENVIMVVEELIGKWSHLDRQSLNDIIFYAIIRVQTMLRQESHKNKYYLNLPLVLEVAEIIGKEVRRARSYKDMAAEEIIEALDVAYKILKADD